MENKNDVTHQGVTTCDVATCDVTTCDVTTCDVTTCDVMSCDREIESHVLSEQPCQSKLGSIECIDQTLIHSDTDTGNHKIFDVNRNMNFVKHKENDIDKFSEMGDIFCVDGYYNTDGTISPGGR